ncbi:MAG: DUF4920 domain-containing protein [bacterium]|jgi:hypothetical protein
MRTAVVLLACAGLALAGETRLGRPLTLTEPIPVARLLENPDQWVGKTVQVKGAIRGVCQAMGCWMQIADSSSPKGIRIKVKDGEIVFPADSVGKTAVAEGRFAKIEMTREQAIAQAKHEAEMNNRTFDPESIKGPVTIYQIQGSGAVILD